LRNFELDGVPFLQTLIPLSRDRTVMHEDVRAVFTSYKTVPFRVVKPLDGSFQSIHSYTPRHEPMSAENMSIDFAVIVRRLRGAVKIGLEEN
jgi:hypothetical protein